MEDSGDRKRRRDEPEQQDAPNGKRVRDDLLLDILYDDADAGDQDLASVMKSLEEEIGLPTTSTPPPLPTQPDLGYLFEASDDELGLPPQAPSSSDEGGEAPEAEAAAAAAAVTEVGAYVEGVGFGQIWGFDDEINGYDVFDLGIRPEEAAAAVAEEGVGFDWGLFDYADVLSGPSDFADLSWRS